MAKFCASQVLDAALDNIATATQLFICPSQPADYTAANSSKLGSRALTGGDFTKANGSAAGRRKTTVAGGDVSVTASGTVTHVALCTASTLLYVTTTTSEAVTASSTRTLGAFEIEFREPT
ncbi:hypothetical protein D3C81_572160 [compost metagenome]